MRTPAVLLVTVGLAGLVGCSTERASVHGQRVGIAGLARQALFNDHEAPRLAGVLAGDGSGRTLVRDLVLTPALHTETGPVETWCASLAASCEDWTPSGAELSVRLPPIDGPYVVHVWARDAAGNISTPVSTTVRLKTGSLALR